jgi:hypothetical protein
MDGRFFTRGTLAPMAAWKQAGAAIGLPTVAADTALGSLHDPPLEPRDEAVFLLTAAAEIEHALMVQYLYAAYSVRVAGPQQAALRRVQDLLTQIAREEMGHLATVENLLQLIGGPVNLGREHSPYASAVYPFRFTLEPVTLGSLAKYVTAESPADLPKKMSPADRALAAQLAADATPANGGQEVQHVGPIFQRLATLFDDPVDGLTDDDFRTDTATRQATFPDWGFTARSPAAAEPLIIESFPGTDSAALRAAATTAVRRIGAQGEGFDTEPAGNGSESHFERFFDIYQRVSTLLAAGVTVTWPVATNPNTTTTPTAPTVDVVEAVLEEQASTGRITEPRARAWAQLFNLRYRLLLGQFAHFLRLDQELYSATPGPQQGDRTARGLLLIGTFDEMRHLSKIASKLVQLPKDDAPGALHAGPTFELPYTLNMPDGEPQRWRMHLDASRASTRLVTAHLDPEEDPFLADLVTQDAAAQARMEVLAEGGALPAGNLPTGFAKAVTILEEAVRGFTIGLHENFWAGQTRDQFVATPVFGETPVALDANGTVVPDPVAAPLMQRLTAPVEDRMPRFRPPVPAARIAYLEQWISDGCQDDDPPGRIGVHHEQDPAIEPPVLP